MALDPVAVVLLEEDELEEDVADVVELVEDDVTEGRGAVDCPAI